MVCLNVGAPKITEKVFSSAHNCKHVDLFATERSIIE